MLKRKGEPRRVHPERLPFLYTTAAAGTLGEFLCADLTGSAVLDGDSLHGCRGIQSEWLTVELALR